MRSYRSSSTFVPIYQFLQELQPILPKSIIFRTLYSYALTDLNDSWHVASVWVATDQVRFCSNLPIFARVTAHFAKIHNFPHFIQLCFDRFEWQLACSFCMSSYRSSSILFPIYQFLQELQPIKNKDSLSPVWINMCQSHSDQHITVLSWA